MRRDTVSIFRPGRALALALGLVLAVPAGAQNLFAPVMQVNGKVITEYELQQRALFFKVLGAPGLPEEAAKDRLIEEKLQLAAADEAGITVTPEQIAAGEEEFAGRINLHRDAFVQALAEAGVEEQTFRDFVIAGLVWRELVRQRFQSKVQVSEADIDNELRAAKPSAAGLRLLYSEIVLPADTPEAKDEALSRAAEIKEYTSFDAFSQAARDYSAAPSKDLGGRVDWVDARNLAPGQVQVLISMGPGQVSDPLPLPNAIALLQLRAVGDGPPPPPAAQTVDYALYMIAGGRSPAALAEAAKIEGQIDTCNDLYSYNRRIRGGAERLQRVSQPLSQVPGDVALELAHMDPGEFSTGLTRGGNLALLMLCSRQEDLPEGTTRDQIRTELQNRMLQILAQDYLAELRDSAVIRVP